ncbi:hypothetical protein BH11BAC5_BH11BAC5_14030 [soil metagenome]
MKTNVQVSFANSNTPYAQDIFQDINQQSNAALIARKGEKLNAQMTVLSKIQLAAVRVITGGLKASNGHIISKENSRTGFNHCY